MMPADLTNILREAEEAVRATKKAMAAGRDIATVSHYRGKVNGLLTAAEILTGYEWEWRVGGIYCNHNNEPTIKC